MSYDTGRVQNPSGNGSWTYAQLLSWTAQQSNLPPPGTQTFCSDVGMRVWNGSYWSVISSFIAGTSRNTCVIFGDSITQENTYQTAAGVVANRPRWFAIANALLGQRLILLNNAGFAGDCTGGANQNTNPPAIGMVARLYLQNYGVGFGQNGQESIDPPVYPGPLFVNPSIVFVMGGFNDIFGSSTPFPNSQIQANLSTIYAACLAAGASVIAMTVTPPYNTTNNVNTATYTQLLALNDWIRYNARNTPGITLVDAFAAMVNPIDTTYPQAPIGWYRDGAIHPNNVGSFAIAQRIVTALQGVMAPDIDSLPTSNVATYANYSSTQLVDNPLLLGSAAATGTGISGNGPTPNPPTYGVAGSLTAVMSVANRADGFGQELSAACTSSTSSDQLLLTWPDVHARAVVGGTYYATMEVIVTGPGAAALAASNNLAGVQLGLQYNNGSQNYFAYDWYYNATLDKPFAGGSFTALLRTPPLTLPAGTPTTFRPFLYAYFQGAGGAVINVGRVGLIRQS